MKTIDERERQKKLKKIKTKDWKEQRGNTS